MTCSSPKHQAQKSKLHLGGRKLKDGWRTAMVHTCPSHPLTLKVKRIFQGRNLTSEWLTLRTRLDSQKTQIPKPLALPIRCLRAMRSDPIRRPPLRDTPWKPLHPRARCWRFARGELDEATACWLQALESLPPSSAAPKGLLGLLPRKEEAWPGWEKGYAWRCLAVAWLLLGSSLLLS